MSNITNTGTPKDKVVKGTVINSKTFNSHIHEIDASNLTNLSVPPVNYKNAIQFNQRVYTYTANSKTVKTTPIYKINDNGFLYAHGTTNSDQDCNLFGASAAEAFTNNTLPAQCDRILLVGFSGHGTDMGAGYIPTVKNHAWVVTCNGNDPSKWIGEYCSTGPQIPNDAFLMYTNIIPKYFYPAYGSYKICVQPTNGYRIIFQKPWSNLLNQYINTTIDATVSSPVEPSDPTGDPSDSPEEPSDPTGEPLDPAAEPSDSTGDTSSSTGDTSDPTGEPSDSTGDTSDSTGDTSDSTEDTSVALLTKKADHFLKVNDPYTMYGYIPKYKTAFKCGQMLDKKDDILGSSIYCTITDPAQILSSIVLNGSSYDSYLYRGVNSKTGFTSIQNDLYVSYNGTPITTYRNNIQTYVFKDFKSDKINKSSDLLLRYMYTAPSSTVAATKDSGVWGYVSRNTETYNGGPLLSNLNCQKNNGVNKITVQVVVMPSQIPIPGTNLTTMNYNVKARLVHQFLWDDISHTNTGSLFSSVSNPNTANTKDNTYYTNCTKMYMGIKCTGKYFIENIIPKLSRDAQGAISFNSSSTKKLFWKFTANKKQYIGYVSNIIQGADNWQLRYYQYQINKTNQLTPVTDIQNTHIIADKTIYEFYEYELNPDDVTTRKFSTYPTQPNPHPIKQYFTNFVSAGETTLPVKTGLSTVFYFWRFRHICTAISNIIEIPSCQLITNPGEFDSTSPSSVIPVSQIPNLINDILNQKNSNNKKNWLVYESLDHKNEYYKCKTWFQDIEKGSQYYGFYRKLDTQINYISYNYSPDCYFETHNLYAEDPAQGTDSSDTLIED